VKFNWQDYDQVTRTVAAEIIYRDGIRKAQYKATYDRARALVAASPALAAVAQRFIDRTATTQDVSAAIDQAEGK
jgi:hypothetical protein